MSAGARGLGDLLEQFFGLRGSAIILLTALVLLILAILWMDGRFYWLYKLIMGDKAKPYVPFQVRYEQRQARIQAKLRAERLEREAREKQDEQE